MVDNSYAVKDWIAFVLLGRWTLDCVPVPQCRLAGSVLSRQKLFPILLPITGMEEVSLWIETRFLFNLVPAPCGDGWECAVYITVLYQEPSELATPADGPDLWIQPSFPGCFAWTIQRKLHVPGINLLEDCLCLANSPKFMLQNRTESLLIPFLKGKCLAVFITLPAKKINHPLNAIILYFTLKWPPYKIRKTN